MAEVANKTTKNKNNNLIFTICGIIIVVALIAVALFFVFKNSTGVSDSYFVSDGNKLVLNLEASDLALEDEDLIPVKAHIVYLYSGDKITGIKMYQQYSNEETAKRAFSRYSELEKETFENISQEGVYVVYTSKSEDYAELTVEDVKSQIEFMQSIRDAEDGQIVTSDDEVTETTDDFNSQGIEPTTEE